ncbi:hypothetical protein MHU86_16614 [Fragilaria crotonensis]|nr:hypothetical protein MHU86_16614 [Fragilaria crotonensis]
MGDNIIRIDTVLDRIKEGNDYETANDFWQAAFCFGDAMGLLFQLAIDMIPQNDEEERILELYQAQCREYLHRGRQALIRALVDEDSKDVSDKDGDPKFITLADDEAKKRVRLFSTLFSKELENDEDVQSPQDQEMPDISQLSAQQCSLEARLKSLNSSLIPSLKSEEERMQDITRGLKGLGVHVDSHADRPKSTIELPVSTDDQVANIIAQVKDELTLDIKNDKAELDVEDDIVLTDEDDTDVTDDQEDDYGDIPKLLNKKMIRNSVINAQLKLAHLLVLLDAKPTAPAPVPVTTVAVTKESLQDEGSDDDIDDIDEQRDAMHEKVELDLDQARALLLKANKYLSRAASAWVVE